MSIIHDRIYISGPETDTRIGGRKVLFRSIRGENGGAVVVDKVPFNGNVGNIGT